VLLENVLFFGSNKPLDCTPDEGAGLALLPPNSDVLLLKFGVYALVPPPPNNELEPP
jgi:hypothetical protein